MPYYPTVNSIRTDTVSIETFRGLNRSSEIGEDEFADMKNMTGEQYPHLAPRRKRGVYASPLSAQGLIAKDALCYIDGTDFVMNGYHTDLALSTLSADCPKTLVGMGAYVIILPDKKFINTQNLSDHGNIEAVFSTQGTVSFTLCRADGSVYNTPTVSAVAPASPANMDLWIDTAAEPHTLRQWSESSGVWVSIPTAYVRIESSGIGAAFRAGDGVTLSGITASGFTALNAAMTLTACGEDYLVVPGVADAAAQQSGSVTVERRMPNMDFVIENENRLWGCRYGVARSGEIVNEIYASKLGDFRNWNCFEGVATDSYAVSCGTDGAFTGAVSYLGNPLFFKENCLHKVYGSFPAQYRVLTSACRGVQKGCARSLAIAGEVLYYKSRGGVCAYDGSLPREIGTALGPEPTADAVGGAAAGKYYLSQRSGDGTWRLSVYDPRRGFWHEEDATHALAFCECAGELYYIDAADGKIRTVFGSGETETDAVEWTAETGDVTLRCAEHKYISRITVRIALQRGAKVRILLRYDGTGAWQSVGTLRGAGLHSFSVPVPPRRCDHFRLRLEGIGEARLHAVRKTVEQGSDV